MLQDKARDCFKIYYSTELLEKQETLTEKLERDIKESASVKGLDLSAMMISVEEPGVLEVVKDMERVHEVGVHRLYLSE